MKILDAFCPIDDCKPVALTIGNFDGVHLGHQSVLSRLRQASAELEGQSVAITFQQHPSQVLRPDRPTSGLITQIHKLKLLQERQIDLLYHVPFTTEFASQSADRFLEQLQKLFPLKQLVLGHDAVIGQNRHGNKETLLGIAEKQHLAVTYLPPTTIDDKPVSSSLIRNHLQQGHFKDVERLLGREYSIYSSVAKGKALGRTIGFPTANIPVSGLCLPPFGVYAVRALIGDQFVKGIANLGIAPTIKGDANPQLEVHLFDFDQNLYDTLIEVFFDKFIRPEMKFDSLEQLQAQIKSDVRSASH